MTDPETGLQVKAEFLAQFATLENWEFPDYGLMVKNAEGEVEADSIEIRLYYERYYGDGNNPMKVEGVFKFFQLFSSAIFSLGHGANDAQKKVNIF